MQKPPDMRKMGMLTILRRVDTAKNGRVDTLKKGCVHTTKDGCDDTANNRRVKEATSLRLEKSK